MGALQFLHIGVADGDLLACLLREFGKTYECECEAPPPLVPEERASSILATFRAGRVLPSSKQDGSESSVLNELIRAHNVR